MTTQSVSYLDTIEHLPVGGKLILVDVPWEEYERLLAELGDSSMIRMSYAHGSLEIMSPSSRHEMYKELLSHLARIVADALGYTLEALGSTTFKVATFRQGAEPAACFYVDNAARIVGKSKIDLSVDPPPDIVVEIDLAHRSTGKLAFYAHLRVPELWCYDQARAQIYRLTEKAYMEVPNSPTFPMLTSDILSRTLEQSRTEGQSAALRIFRQWLRANFPPIA